MTQEINLYKVTPKKEEFFSFRQIVLAMLGAIALFALITLYDVYDYYLNKKSLTDLQKKQNALNNQLLEVSAKVPPQQTKEQLELTIKKLQSDLDARKEILSTLSVMQSTKTQGFSGYLRALAEQSFSGIWLTSFVLQGDGSYIKLEGFSQRPEYVPKFLEGLSHEEIFKGKNFKEFHLTVDRKKEVIHFVVESFAVKEKPDTGEGGGANAEKN